MNAAPETTAVMDRLAHLARVVNGRLVGADAAFAGVNTDTRKIRAGDIYVALSGERFDGHDFVMQAAQQGAAGAMVERPVAGSVPQVITADALLALQDYAAHWRARFDIPVIAVTGSNGKTTTKEMLAAIFLQQGPVLATLGNLNNHIGVPLTLTRLRAEHQAAIVEMGANHAGEIALLARIGQPDIAVITQAGAAHLEGFGSREGVARAKGELFAGLGSGALAVINADDSFAGLWRELAAHCRQLSFGIEQAADVSAREIRETVDSDGGRLEFELVSPQGNAPVHLPMLGRHNVMNALAAAGCALGAGLSPQQIASGLSAMQGVSGRLIRKPALNGAHLIDDTYNANPSSLAAALDVLARLPGARWLALGDMAELGDEGADWHRQAGEWARASGVEKLFAVGPLSREAAHAFGAGAEHFADHRQLTAALIRDLHADVTVLVKGSRSMHMEQVVQSLLAPVEVKP